MFVNVCRMGFWVIGQVQEGKMDGFSPVESGIKLCNLKALPSYQRSGEAVWRMMIQH